ncbi:CDP-alcohol phosphatidyltransferase family protein [Candidatus Bathyarchaeota archaeon]|nr:CDP-alcohol phosphatidyltransferase family protein [Candidatus Bathyarchaeota archaeon]
MALEPERLGPAAAVKRWFDRLLGRLPFLAELNPDQLSGLGLLLSLAVYYFLSREMIGASILVLFAALFLDVLDGVVARAQGKASEEGWVVDIAVDRVSEALISLALSRLVVLAVVFNVALSLYSYMSRRHLIIPIRQVLLLALAVYYFVGVGGLHLFLDGILFRI